MLTNLKRAALAALCTGMAACGATLPQGAALTPAGALEARAAMATVAPIAGLTPERMYATRIHIGTTENLSLIDRSCQFDGKTRNYGDHFDILILYSPTQGDVRCGTALFHELYHVALILKTGDGDAEHLNPQWGLVDQLAFTHTVCGETL